MANSDTILRELASAMLRIDHPGTKEAWALWSGADPSGTIQSAYDLGHMRPEKICNFLCSIVTQPELAKFVHRLQRRTVGLGDMWENSAGGNRNPHDCTSKVLLKFICEAISTKADRVSTLKGPFLPFMETAVRIAHHVNGVTQRMVSLGDHLNGRLGPISDCALPNDGATTGVCKDIANHGSLATEVTHERLEKESGTSDTQSVDSECEALSSFSNDVDINTELQEKTVVWAAHEPAQAPTAAQLWLGPEQISPKTLWQ